MNRIDYSFIINNEKLICYGIDFGPKGLIIIKNKMPWLLVKNPGHQFWTGRFITQCYKPTEYFILHMKNNPRYPHDSSYPYVAKTYESMEVSHKWKTALKLLLQHLDNYSQNSKLYE